VLECASFFLGGKNCSDSQREFSAWVLNASTIQTKFQSQGPSDFSTRVLKASSLFGRKILNYLFLEKNCPLKMGSTNFTPLPPEMADPPKNLKSEKNLAPMYAPRKFWTLKTLRTRTQHVCLLTHLFERTRRRKIAKKNFPTERKWVYNFANTYARKPVEKLGDRVSAEFL
jgi:hypothetical protein